MAIPAPIQSAYGNGPGNIDSPVPSGATGMQAAKIPNSPAGQGAAPQAGETPAPQANPFDTPLTPEEQGRLRKQAAGETNPFDEKDPHFPTGYTPITPRVRKNPAGDLEVLRPTTNKWEPMDKDDVERLSFMMDRFHEWGMRAKEDIPRFVGMMLGSTIGARFGAAGATVGAGIGNAAGGAVGDAWQGKQTTAGGAAIDVATGAAAELIPRGVGGYLAKKEAQAAAEAAIAPAVKAGSEVLQQRAADRLAAAQELGLPLRKDQLSPENVGVASKVDQIMMSKGPEAEKLAAAQAIQKQMLMEKRDNIIDRLQGPYKGEIGDQGANFAQTFGTILDNHEAAISTLKNKAFDASNGESYAIDPVLSSMRDQITKRMTKNIFNDSGTINSQLLDDVRQTFGTIPGNAQSLISDYMRLQNAAKVSQGVSEVGAFKNASLADEAAVPVGGKSDASIASSVDQGVPKSKPGLTLKEMDVFRKKFGDDANFQSRLDRNEVERAYGEVYYSMRSHMDQKMIDALKPTDPQAAARLMGHKEFYSTFKEDIADFQRAVEHDPTNAAQALVDPKDPAKVRSLLAVLDDKQRKYVAGGFLENLTHPLIDETGKLKVTPVETAWKKVDPKIKSMLFGDDVKTIDSLVSYSRAIGARDLTSYDPTRDPLTQRALGALKSLKTTGGIDFVNRIFQRTPKARDYLTSQASDILMPAGQDAGSLAKRQILMQRSSRAIMSMPVRAGVKAMMADMDTEHPEGQPAQ